MPSCPDSVPDSNLVFRVSEWTRRELSLSAYLLPITKPLDQYFLPVRRNSVIRDHVASTEALTREEQVRADMDRRMLTC